MTTTDPAPSAAAPSTAFTLRAAAPPDADAIVRLIEALAAYERLSHLCQATPERLARHLFGERPVIEALVAEVPATGDAPARVVGFALFFTNFSTFLCQPGLYLEDLFVEPERRGLGIGKALLKALARLAVDRDCGRFDWSVLDWNAPSIRFYEAMGAVVLPDWRTCRVTGEALRALAARS